MAVIEKLEPIRLQWSQKENSALIEPDDKDRYMMTIGEIIQACAVYQKLGFREFADRFKSLADTLGKWAHERRAKFSKAFLTIRDTNFLFLLVTKSQEYDAELEAELTDLDLTIAHNSGFSDISLSVQALPHCTPDTYISFCDPKWTLEYVDASRK
jgi:hypothetical protein